MTVVDQFASYKDIVQGSFENAVGAVEEIQQTVVEVSLDILTELGVPAETAKSVKETHRRVAHTFYSGMCHVTDEFGDLIVDQVRVVLGLPKDEPGDEPGNEPRTGTR